MHVSYTVGEQLTRSRARMFVGRAAELATIRRIVAGGQAERCVYVQGVAGVGKSELLHACARQCVEQRVRVGWIEGQRIDATPQAFIAAIRNALGLLPTTDGEHELSDTLSADPHALILDSFDHLRSIETWLRCVFLPSLPASTVLIFAGRARLDDAWRAEPGWHSLLHVLSLGNFDPTESALYLEQWGVAESLRPAILESTYGHPFALALVADVATQSPDRPLRLCDHPEVVDSLLTQFIEEVPSELHRQGLECCAVALYTTEDLLRCLIGPDHAHVLFEWLRGLSFVHTGPRGLTPHQLIHQTLVADLRWRDPTRHRELVELTRDCYFERGQRGDSLGRRGHFDELGWLMSQFSLPCEPLVAHCGRSNNTCGPMDDREWPGVEALLRKHVGEQAVEIARFWRDNGGDLTVVRNDHPASDLAEREPGRHVVGFALLLRLETLTPEQVAFDPGVAPIHAHLESLGACTPQQPCLYVRYMMCRQSHVAATPARAPLTAYAFEQMFRTRNLAFGIYNRRDPETWFPQAELTKTRYYPAGDFEIDGYRYGCFGDDLRDLSFMGWFAQMFASVTGTRNHTHPLPVPLGREAFNRAVKQALKALDRPDLLQSSPLCWSNLVTRRCGSNVSPHDRAVALTRVVRAQCGHFLRSPRDADYHRVLEQTYLKPTVKQRVAAAELNMPFGTYRRYLGTAVGRLTELLWLEEIAHGGKPV